MPEPRSARPPGGDDRQRFLTDLVRGGFMTAQAKRIDAAGLKAALHDGGEIALLDAREEVPFDARHLLMASCVPLSRVELLVDACVPRRSARVVWCDDGDGLAARAASRL